MCFVFSGCATLREYTEILEALQRIREVLMGARRGMVVVAVSKQGRVPSG